MSRIITAYSPGRMDVMGGIADYSGSRVLQMPISLKASVSIQAIEADYWEVQSTDPDLSNASFRFPLNLLKSLEKNGYAEVIDYLHNTAGGNWAAYVIGSLAILFEHYPFAASGALIKVDSKVPTGKGVSSSAALEVATIKAAIEFFGINVKAHDIPLMAQKAENYIVGAPCGLMDQLASFYGLENHLLPITCRPDLVDQPIKIPQGWHFVGIDSGVKHAVSGASYTDVRTAAFMGLSIINEEIKTELNAACLCEISVSEYMNSVAPHLPEGLVGETFSSKYNNYPDAVTKVIPRHNYAVKNCTEHPIYENQRVSLFEQIIRNTSGGNDTAALNLLGELMYQSHYSYNRCGLGNEVTDLIVEKVKLAQAKGKQVFGAKITGGGSGGTVCVLAYETAGLTTVEEIKKEIEGVVGKKLLTIS